MIFLMSISIAVMISILGWMLLRGLSTAAKNYQNQFQSQAQMQLSDAFIFFDPVHLWSFSLGLGISILLVVWLVTRSFLVAFLLGVFFLFVPKLLISFLKIRRLRLFDKQLPDFLLTLSGALRSGAGIQNAFPHLSAELPQPLAQELTLIVRKQRIGVPFYQCLDELAQRIPTEACLLMVSALKIGAQSGGNLAEAIEQIAAMVRDRLQIQGRIKALTSQGKMQAWVMSLLPIVLMLVLSKLDPVGMHYLWHSLIGWMVLLAIVLLEMLGVWMISKIVRIDV